MAFALTFCPGVAWIILKFQHIASISFLIPIIDMNYTIWRIFLLLCASLSGIATVLLFFLPESPKFLLAHERHDEALQILRDICRRNRRNNSVYLVKNIVLDETQIIEHDRDQTFIQIAWHQTRPIFKCPLLAHTIRTSFIMFSLFAASSGFLMWTPDILNKLLDHEGMNYTVCDVVPAIIRFK